MGKDNISIYVIENERSLWKKSLKKAISHNRLNLTKWIIETFDVDIKLLKRLIDEDDNDCTTRWVKLQIEKMK